MPSFKGWLSNTGRQAAKFFNTTIPQATQQGVRFLNTHIVPTAKKLHHVQKVIGNEVTTNQDIPEKFRQKAQKASAFADLGLSKLEAVQAATNRVAGNLGLT